MAGAVGGASELVPGETAEESALLQPLFEDDSTIESASGDALIELAKQVGLARGYALCRCAISPDQAPESSTDLIACAREESGQLGRTLNQDTARCLSEALAADPALEPALRCDLRWAMSDGREWLRVCWEPRPDGTVGSKPVADNPNCPRTEELSTVVLTCGFVIYCTDGTRVEGSRCNGTFECNDGLDEHACFEVRGRDMIQCGDHVEDPSIVCRSGACADSEFARWCDPLRPDRLLCGDGTDVSGDVVCDRVDDCAERTDERYCLR
jgi:hypothetical protein